MILQVVVVVVFFHLAVIQIQNSDSLVVIQW